MFYWCKLSQPEADNNALWDDWKIVMYDWYNAKQYTNIKISADITPVITAHLKNFKLEYKNVWNVNWTIKPVPSIILPLNSGYMKYDLKSLNLDKGDFAIEMRVNFPSANPGGTRFLFQLGDYQLFFHTNWNIIMKNSALKFSTIDYNALQGFQRVTAIKEWDKYTLTIGDNIIFDKETLNSDVWSELFVWVFDDSWTYKYQLNNIIDYVKIYKK